VSNNYPSTDYRHDIEDIRDRLGELESDTDKIGELDEKFDRIEEQQNELIGGVNRLINASNQQADTLREIKKAIGVLTTVLQPKPPSQNPPPDAPIPFKRPPAKPRKPKAEDTPPT